MERTITEVTRTEMPPEVVPGQKMECFQANESRRQVHAVKLGAHLAGANGVNTSSLFERQADTATVIIQAVNGLCQQLVHMGPAILVLLGARKGRVQAQHNQAGSVCHSPLCGRTFLLETNKCCDVRYWRGSLKLPEPQSQGSRRIGVVVFVTQRQIASGGCGSLAAKI